MTSPGMDRSETNPQPVSVKVNNFPESPRARKTTVKTYVLDPAATDKSQRFAEIAAYEPTRCRLVLQVLDQPIILIINESPIVTPDVTTVSAAPGQGRVIPASVEENVLYGPDQMWLNTVSGATVGRVTVTKEYL